MTNFDFKSETPATSLPSTGFIFGADSQAVSTPSIYPVSVLKEGLGLDTSVTIGRLARYTDATGTQGETAGLYEDPTGDIGIGTTSPDAPLHVNVGEAGLANGPATIIQGGGGTPTSVQLLLRNTRDGPGALGLDYENEVHLRFQAGTAENHRRYLNFANFSGVDQWLTGVNASNVWIMYDVNGCHRLWFESPGGTAPNNTGNSFINSAGAGAVVVNGGNSDGDTTGTGGFRVDAGGTYPRAALFEVRPRTATDAVLKASNNGSGYAPASLLLKAEQGAIRGQGVFMRNDPAGTSWFAGVPYNASSAKWSITFASQATWDPIVAQTSNALLTVQSDGKVGMGTVDPVCTVDALGAVRTRPVTVASLPSAALGDGMRHMVTDSSVAASGNFGAAVVGGGANVVPVYSSGGAWYIG